jgi:hypothetical protein
MENDCFYQSAVGIRKACQMFSIKYVKTDTLYAFFKTVRETDDASKFVLVTGSSDFSVPSDVFPSFLEFLELLNDERIIIWYAENCTYTHKKIIKLPIGMDYHTLHNNISHEWGVSKTPIEQETDLLKIKINSSPFYMRRIKIYSNCHFQTWTKYGNQRVQAIQTIPGDLMYLEPCKIDRNSSWAKQINYAFVLSPHGNGLDCHRTWEALILGCIPIVKKSNIDELYDKLPVLIVNEWVDINKELLMNTISKFKLMDFDYSKLTMKYWIERIFC